MTQTAYFQNEFVPIEAAKISIMTHAFLYGTGVFEGIRAYWCPEDKCSYVFRGLEHFERLKASAKMLRIEIPQSPEELLKITIELLRRNDLKEDVYIRPIAYKAGERIGPALLDNKDDFCMFCVPLGDYIDTNKGVSVMVSSWRRVDDNAIPARAKVNGSYVNSALAKTEALLNNFADAIVLDHNGHVAEGSAMNLFMVRKGKLITSTVTDNILEGITRDSIITLATQELGLTVQERQIDRTELYIADELFFCGTGAQVSPVISVDNYAIGDGKVGAISIQLRDMYFQAVRNNLPKYSAWCQKV